MKIINKSILVVLLFICGHTFANTFQKTQEVDSLNVEVNVYNETCEESATVQVYIKNGTSPYTVSKTTSINNTTSTQTVEIDSFQFLSPAGKFTLTFEDSLGLSVTKEIDIAPSIEIYLADSTNCDSKNMQSISIPITSYFPGTIAIYDVTSDTKKQIGATLDFSGQGIYGMSAPTETPLFIEVKSTGGCESEQYLVIPSCKTTSIDVNRSPEQDKMRIHPNPSNGLVYFDGYDNNPKSIKIYDSMGKMIFIRENVTESLNIENLKEGIYYLKVTTNNKVYSHKLIKD